MSLADGLDAGRLLPGEYCPKTIQIGLTIGVGIIGGVYGDRWLGTSPWLTMLGLLIGVVSGFTRLYQIGKELSK